MPTCPITPTHRTRAECRRAFAEVPVTWPSEATKVSISPRGRPSPTKRWHGENSRGWQRAEAARAARAPGYIPAAPAPRPEQICETNKVLRISTSVVRVPTHPVALKVPLEPPRLRRKPARSRSRPDLDLTWFQKGK